MNLPRVLEPEVMDTPVEAQEYDEMDHSQVNRAFVDDLLCAAREYGVLDSGSEDLVIDLGTGTAQIPIELCKRHDSCRITAVDLSIQMLEIARYNIEVEGVIDRVQLRRADGKHTGFSEDCCSVVMSNSIVHHVPQPMAVLAEAVRLTAPGGVLFFRDLMRPPDQPTLDHLVETYAGKENEFQQKMFADSLHAALALEEIQSLVEVLGFSASTAYASSDRHWTWTARMP